MLTIRASRHFLTASYDGAIRVFDYSQKLLHTVSAHTAPVSSIAVVSSDSPDSHLIASASHDLTALLTRVDLSSIAGPSKAQTFASLRLHTAPLFSVVANASGSHILTSSWDGLIGLWDTSIPATDEVPADETAGGDRKKRRKVAAGDGEAPRPKRKAPAAVLRSHTARVSRAVFGRDGGAYAYSCGFDSTVRTWDVENGVCTATIVRYFRLHSIFVRTHAHSDPPTDRVVKTVPRPRALPRRHDGARSVDRSHSVPVRPPQFNFVRDDAGNRVPRAPRDTVVHRDPSAGERERASTCDWGV